jgi:hypothetical protein
LILTAGHGVADLIDEYLVVRGAFLWGLLLRIGKQFQLNVVRVP